MALNTFLDFSTTAASNVDVAGIGIQGANAVSNFDNAFRQLMAILRSDLDNGMVVTSKSANYTAVANDNNGIIRFSAAATLSLTAAATLGANWHVLVVADGGAVVIDPNGAETINGSATITIPDGSSAMVWCTGTAFFTTKDFLNVQPTLDVASATTTDLGAVASWNVRITGTTTITGFGTVAEGTLKFVRMAGALTLTHNATSLILPGGANITTASDDYFIAKSLGSGNWAVLAYFPSRPVPNTANGQYKFPSTQNPSSDVNTLDDYEEGTWTPTLAFSGASVGITYATQNGRYTKVGNMVTVWCRLVLTSKGSSTGVAKIGGLPFTASSAMGFYAGTFPYFGNSTSVTTQSAMIAGTTAVIDLYNGTANVTNANVNNASDFVVSVSYEAA